MIQTFENFIKGVQQNNHTPNKKEKDIIEFSDMVSLAIGGELDGQLVDSAFADFYKEVQWVDLGGDVLWADRNVGAKSPDDPGVYFTVTEMEKIKFPNGWNVPGKEEVADLCEHYYDMLDNNDGILVKDRLIIPNTGYVIDGGRKNNNIAYFWINGQNHSMLYCFAGCDSYMESETYEYTDDRKFTIRLVKNKHK